ncbi:FGGY-family carbohydrate kinase [Candidatus Hydrogenedentota bacterium]
MDCFLGIDAGTGGARAIAFDETGRVVSCGSSVYGTNHAAPGWSEQDPKDWRRGAINAISKAISGLTRHSARIVAAGLTHQRHSFVPVGKGLAPLRPGILWNDLRCGPQVDWTRKNIDLTWLFRRTGYPPFGWSIYKIMWLRDNEPQVYDKTEKFLLVHDYLINQLTGVCATTQSSCTMTGCFDMETMNGWAHDVLGKFGIAPEKFVATILPAGALIGELLPEIAEETGLPQGLPFYAAAGDQVCGVLGAGISHPGTVGINGGTSLTLQAVVENFPDCSQPNFSIEIHPTGRYAAEAVLFSGVSALMKWLVDNFGCPAGVHEENSWGEIYNMAAECPPGNEGLLLVPSLQGLGGPEWDTEARASLVGMNVCHGYGHLVRAVLEGCAYEVRFQIELMGKGIRAPISEIRSYGGSSRSDIYNRIIADVSGLPVSVPSTPETTTLGAAMCAAVGHGVFKSFDEAASSMCGVARVFEPDRDRGMTYSNIYHRKYLREREEVLRRSVLARDAE